MVREGPAELPPHSAPETTEARQARAYGLLLTSLIIAAVIVVVAYIILR
ncbi:MULTISPECIES: hypothetical protein [unclassified Bradyrhizobium]|nr:MULTISPECIES: hypothetical protein [unclassified Bradyrhizobium]WGS17951.1 hypothetical protein MTX22_25515 [Bradyrhizobium sp. ISRA463]WGS24757.1 hypothetical protein MTX19_23175 [Bradyrhizobium sp. ISRA464]